MSNRRMVTTKRNDFLNRQTSVASTSTASGQTPFSFAYAYNSANQRTRVTNSDNSYWSYQYDTLGQVISGKHHWADGTRVAGQQFEFGFDDIGNRQSAIHGGNASGSNLRVETYTANSVNQYTQRTVPGFAELQGQARADATVTVNVQTTERYGSYWRYEHSVNNSTGAVQQTLGIVGVLQGAGPNGTDVVATNATSIFLPQTPETFTHDADGNLLRDGRWNYSWDAENRLTSFTSLTNLPAASRRKLDCAYDPHFRRTRKVSSLWNGYAYIPQTTNYFVYDGWNLAAQFDGGGQLEKSFLWGTDLSGTPQGAGGVGGLTAMTLHQGAYAGTYLYCCDGGGNVAALVSATTGEEMARYEYGPFGELLRASGPLAFLNPFRFSTKFCDDETGLYYYGYRYYDPSAGRWSSRDPIEERGGLNIYAMVGNDPVNYVDPYGLKDWFDFNVFLITDLEAWGALLHHLAIGDKQSKIDPNSNRALLNAEGITLATFTDESGYTLTGDQIAAMIGGAVIVGTVTAITDGLGNAGKCENAVNGLGRQNQLFKSALIPFNDHGWTKAGREATKHPEYFGFKNFPSLQKIYNTPEKINRLAADSLKEIMRNGKMTTGASGRYPNGWRTITLPDGRAASWHSDGSFIGFRGIQP